MIAKGFLVLESGDVFSGCWHAEGKDRAGEVVFNTGHSGYEEMATDPSYFSQILVNDGASTGQLRRRRSCLGVRSNLDRWLCLSRNSKYSTAKNLGLKN